MFHLTFNLPHFTLRTSAKARADQRKWPDGNPLRKYYDVSFLDDKNESGLSSFLYETQVSCTIAGPDEGDGRVTALSTLTLMRRAMEKQFAPMFKTAWCI